MTLFALSLPSFAGGIADIASDLPLGFVGGFPRRERRSHHEGTLLNSFNFVAASA
jgi:hypothetical protein